MKNLIFFSKNVSWFRNLKVIHLLSVILILTVVACQKDDTFNLNNSDAELKSASKSKNPGQRNVVMVKTEHMDFQMPDEILSGWTTFRYKNKDHHTHFFLIEKMPVDSNGVQKDLDDYFEEVVPVFDTAMALINEEELYAGLAEFANLPYWSFFREYIGGVGLVGPGKTGETTQYLEPGLYIIECYVKTNGKFHTSDGMAAQFIVKEEKSTAKPPKAGLHLYVDSLSGYKLVGTPKPGMNTMKVNYENQKVYGNFVGHDVNIVKLDGASDDDIKGWMNWVDIDGLNTPAPATFLGGVQEMPGGSTAYVKFRLEPGETYGIVAEVPYPVINPYDPEDPEFFYTFTVN